MSNEEEDKILRKETLRKEEQVYREAMETYRHLHGYIIMAFVVIGGILGAGIIFRWVDRFWDNGVYGWAKNCLSNWICIAIIALGAVILLLILSIIIYLFIYARESRMKILEVACEIEESWFLDKDNVKSLAYTLMEIEERGPLCWIIKIIRRIPGGKKLLARLRED